MNYYEDVMDQLNKYSKEEYMKLENEEDKEKYINDIFNIYRSINKFPINYYDDKGIEEEIIKCVNKDVSEWNGEILDFKANLKYLKMEVKKKIIEIIDKVNGE